MHLLGQASEAAQGLCCLSMHARPHWVQDKTGSHPYKVTQPRQGPGHKGDWECRIGRWRMQQSCGAVLT